MSARRATRRTALPGAFVVWAILSAARLFLPPLAFAQAPPQPGVLSGIVTNSQGQPVAGVVVVATNHATTGGTWEARSRADGVYTITGLLPGKYSLHLRYERSAEDRKQNPFSLTAKVVTVSGGVAWDGLPISLDWITLEHRDTGRETRPTTRLEPDDLANLPLNPFRNYQSLIILTPGAQSPTFANAENDTPQRSLTLRVNNQSGPAIRTQIDGATNVNLWLPAHTVYVPPVEAIETATVSTGVVDASQGMAAGAAIAVAIKSGTNTARGSMFEFFNKHDLNAVPFGGGRKLPIQRHSLGGTVGGPLQRNRLFAFGSYEGYFSRADALRFYSVPDERLRNGDFSQAFNNNGTLQRIFDPFTPGANTATGTGRAQISYVGPPACATCTTGLNVLDPARTHPIAKRILALYPLPNRLSGGAGGFSNNFSRVESSATDRHNVDVKLTAAPSNREKLWGRLSYMRAVVDDRWVFPIDPVAEDGGLTKTWQIAGGYTRVLGPVTTFEGSVALTVLDQHVNSSDSFLGQYGLEVLGIPGANSQGRTDVPTPERYAGLPSFTTGFSTIGTTPTWAPQTRDERTISARADLTRLFGKHEVRTGYFLNRFALDHWQPERQNPRGSFQFASNATRLGGGGQQSANFYNTYAALLFGLVGTAAKSIQSELFTTRESQHALYIQDRWSSASSRLTISAGLRWEYYPLMQRDGRGLEMTDLDTLEILVGGRGGVARDLGLSAPKGNFAPRLGGSLFVDERTKVRAAYGLSFDGLAWASPFRGDRSYPTAINSRFVAPPALQTFGWFGTLADGIPFIPLPDVNAARLTLPSTVADQRTLEAETLERPRVHSWTVGVERDLPARLYVDVAYVGNKGLDGWMDINVNAVQTLGGGAADRPYNVTPFFTTQPITVFRGYTDSSYHALQLAAYRMFLGGLMLRGSYTLGRSMVLGREYELPEFEDRNWHPAASDRTHTFTAAFVWELPWQSGRGPNGALGWLLNDWQLNGIVTAFSGAPFTVRADGTELNTPGNVQTADLIGPLVKIGEIGNGGFYYDPFSFFQPGGQRLGDTTINQFRGPGGANLDVSVFRNIRLAGNRRLQLRLEALNATNTPKYGLPEGNLFSSSFMQVSSFNDAYTERQIRLAARFSF